MSFLKELFGERVDNSWCIVRLFCSSAGVALIYKFLVTPNPDLLGFGGAVSAIGLAIAGKNLSERENR